MTKNEKIVHSAIEKIDEILPLLARAKALLAQASALGIADVFLSGGWGFVAGTLKRSRMSDSDKILKLAVSRLNQLFSSLKKIQKMPQFSEDLNYEGWSLIGTVIDLVFDNKYVDAFVVGQLFAGINEISDLESSLHELRDQLDLALLDFDSDDDNYDDDYDLDDDDDGNDDFDDYDGNDDFDDDDELDEIELDDADGNENFDDDDSSEEIIAIPVDKNPVPATKNPPIDNPPNDQKQTSLDSYNWNTKVSGFERFCWKVEDFFKKVDEFMKFMDLLLKSCFYLFVALIGLAFCLLVLISIFWGLIKMLFS